MDVKNSLWVPAVGKAFETTPFVLSNKPHKKYWDYGNNPQQ
jgi:hypothetical protein